MSQNKKSISFLIPSVSSHPAGGYKVIYEQANRLVNDGYKVLIVYPVICRIKKQPLKTRIGDIKRFFTLYLFNLHKDISPVWFNTDKRIAHRLVFTPKQRNVPKTTFYCATALATSYFLQKYKVAEKNKIYYIQDFEAWDGHTDEQVYHSYRFPMKKIVIAPWLAQRVEYAGEKSVLIPNGFDFGYFQLINPIENRLPYEVVMLYHKDDRKRCCDSIEALKIVKQKIPQLHVTMFGTPEKPELPEWFDYIRCPDKETHNKIYNDAAIFVAASKTEGFGLTVGESMICGCAVACTDNEGFSMMVRNEQTGLLSPVFDIEKLAENILRLIQNDHLRIRIAKQGNEFIQQFTWEKAYNSFKRILEE